jgi:hypothetical protein
MAAGAVAVEHVSSAGPTSKKPRSLPRTVALLALSSRTP